MGHPGAGSTRAGCAGPNIAHNGLMDLTSLALFISGTALFVLAAVTLQAAMAARGRLLDDRAEMDQAHALALREESTAVVQVRETMAGDLAAARAERDQIRTQFEGFVSFLVDQGVLRKGADPLEVTPGDLVYEVSGPVAGLPHVGALTDAELMGALRHAADRGGNNPFSRAHMVDRGPLTRTTFEALRRALVDGGYLETPRGNRKVYALTDRGRALLQDATESAA
jgi:hypothetical protein